ncbi:MAG: hypothetical protein ACTHMS_18495 [Jatrophihabitans sp.]|uniref:hypothetical protein n=1 Tax=Jatrophihabitans sp. TaxID=1932789 RepID=UPI003F8177B6
MSSGAVTRAALLGWVLRLVTAAGLVVDAVIHADLAASQPPGGGISQTQLFYGETVVSGLAAVLVLLIASKLAYAFAFLVAVSALAAVVLSRYVDIGPVGPLPDLYEPFWYASKIATALAEAAAAVGAVVALLTQWRTRSRGSGPGRRDTGVAVSITTP